MPQPAPAVLPARSTAVSRPQELPARTSGGERLRQGLAKHSRGLGGARRACVWEGRERGGGVITSVDAGAEPRGVPRGGRGRHPRPQARQALLRVRRRGVPHPSPSPAPFLPPSPSVDLAGSENRSPGIDRSDILRFIASIVFSFHGSAPPPPPHPPPQPLPPRGWGPRGIPLTSRLPPASPRRRPAGPWR